MRSIKKWRKVITLTVAAVTMSVGLVASVSQAQGPSTDVWIDVVKGPSLARISVTVPMMYGFAVHGTLVNTDSTPISVDNHNLLVSNVKVSVLDPGSSQSDYEVQVEGVAHMPVRNYSTDVLESDLGTVDPPRVGLSVRLQAAMMNPTNSLGVILTPQEKAYWQHIADTPTDQLTDFKKYRISLDGQAFKKEYADEPGLIYLEDRILLPEPPDLATNGYAASGFAYIPAVSYLPVAVEVGGQRGQYSQVEQSVKVGKIVWGVEAVDQPATP